MTDAGWYPDPADPDAQRYFDGSVWTEHRAAPQPAHVTAPSGSWTPPPTGAWTAPQPGPHPPVGPATTFAPAGTWAAPTGPAPRSRRRRLPLVIAAIVVLVAAGTGVGIWRARSSSAPKLTFHGQAIHDPAAALDQAQTQLAALVTQRHGVRASTTRCYFAQPRTPTSGAKTDVLPVVICGPVLFVDGVPAKEYLQYFLTPSAAGKQTTFTVSANPVQADPGAVPATTALVRPDGRAVPSGAGGLAPPTPPAAPANVLVAAGLGPISGPPALTNASMISRTTGVQVEQAGVVTRYGAGDAARGAPAGQQLIAFQFEATPGEYDNVDPGDYLKLAVSGQPDRAVPETDGSDEFVVAAVPTGATARLVLTHDGYTQSLDLPSGKPGPNNLTVLTRTVRQDAIGKKFTVSVRFSEGGYSSTDTLHATFTSAYLGYWVAAEKNQHPAQPGDGFVELALNYTDPKSSGGPFGFDPEQLTLLLPDGRKVHARNLAPAGRLYNVFEVPGTFTKGTLQITGTERFNDVTATITTTRSIPISFAAG